MISRSPRARLDAGSDRTLWLAAVARELDTLNRAIFVRSATLAGLAPGAAARGQGRSPTAPASRAASLRRQGPKPVVRDNRAVCSSDHPLVTATILKVMRDGGNAADAAV